MNPIEDLLKENERLIYAIANYFNHDKEDLYQVGVIGLIKAHQNYKPNKLVKFTTYAYPYILGEMKKFVRENKPIKVSKELTSLNSKIEKAYTYLTQQLMKEPTTKELADFLEVPETFVNDALNSRNIPQSLDSLVDEMSLYEIIESKEAIPIDSLLELKTSFNRLNSLDQELITKRYLQDQTQTEISEEYGVNQVRISRMEQKVLRKLKTYMQ